MGLIQTAPPHTQKTKRTVWSAALGGQWVKHPLSAALAPRDTSNCSHGNYLFPWTLSAHSVGEEGWSGPPQSWLGNISCSHLWGKTLAPLDEVTLLPFLLYINSTCSWPDAFFLQFQLTKCWSFTVLWVINGVSHPAGSPDVFFRISKAGVQVPGFELLRYTVSVCFFNMAAGNLLRWVTCRVAIGLFFPRPSLFSVWSPDWQLCISWGLWELQNLGSCSRTTESESAF